MEQIYLGIVLIGIIIMVLVPVHFGNYTEREVLGKNNMTYLKGMACIMVVVTHTCTQLGGEGILILPSNIGTIAVGIFFFWSGYGLMYSYLNKENYLKGFVTKRILLVYVPFVFANAIFLLCNFIEQEVYSFIETVKYLLGIKLICGHAWYIQTIIILYILFYLSAKVSNGNKKKFILLLAICIIVYKGYEDYIANPSDMYRGNVIPFLVGYMVACIDSRKVECWIRKNYKTITFAITFLFSATFFYISIFRWHIPCIDPRNKIICVITTTVCQSSFVILTLVISLKVRFQSKLVNYIGKISYEVYLLHQIAIDISKYFFMKYNLAATLLSAVVLAIIIGSIFYMFDNKMIYMKKSNRFIQLKN